MLDNAMFLNVMKTIGIEVNDEIKNGKFSNLIIKKEEMTNAASVQNLIKNVGCAVGTSSVGFLVSSYSQIYQSYLVDKLTLLQHPFSISVAEMSAKFAQMGIDMSTASGMAYGKIYKMLL